MSKEREKNQEWVGFTLKIIYIYEKLFKNNKEKLVSAFSVPSLSPVERKKKKRTIENWLKLDKKIKRPNKFYLNYFKISDYTLPDGTTLLPYDAFVFWSIEKFRQRIDEYLSVQKQNARLEERIKYIYYYDIDHEELAFYEVSFPNVEKPYELNLYSRQLTNSMLYKGEMREYQSMLYLTLKNEFDYMHYIFENFATVFSQEVRIFGTGQCKDYFSRKPKAYIALLTSSLLSEEEERAYAHKLNRSNLLIAKPFSRYNKTAKEYLIENFTNKIDMLGKDLDYYKDDINRLYYQLALQTFTSYKKIAKKLSYNEDYFVRNKKSVKQLIFNSLALAKNEQTEKIPKVEILYALTTSNITLLEVDNYRFPDIIEEQIELIEEKRVELSYLFVVTDKKLINDKVLQRLIALEKHIPLKIIENSRVHYEEIIYPHDEPFMIYQTFNDVGNYVHITKHSKDRRDISREYQLLYHESVSLNEFITEIYPLNGKWYSYSFGSKMDNQNYHTFEFEITNNTIRASFPLGVHFGIVQECKEYILLLFDNSIIKIQNSTIYDTILLTSIIGKERNIHNKDVLLFGLMSREKIEKKDVCRLLDAIQKKEHEHFRLKICDGFDSILGEFQNRLRIPKNRE